MSHEPLPVPAAGPAGAAGASDSTPAPDAAPARFTRVARTGAAATLLAVCAGALAWALAEGLNLPPAVAAAIAAATALLPLAVLVWRLASEVDAARAALALPLSAPLPAGMATGVPDRREFLALAEREWARARRYGGEPVLLLVDIDRFARLTETRGPEAAEALMRALAADITPTLRTADVLGRFGGSQLAVWLVQADATGALDAADRIRERCENLDLRHRDQHLRVTASVGVAALRPAHQNLTQLVIDAESAVQAARQAGGNCVRAAPVDVFAGRRIGPSVGDNQPL